MRFVMVMAVIVCLLAAGCAGNNPLLGKWQDTLTGNTITEYTSDGKVTMTVAGVAMGSMPYTVSGNQLTVGPGKILGADMPASTKAFKVSGDTLTLGEGTGAITFKRVK